MKIETTTLKTVANFAKLKDVTAVTIYRWAKENKCSIIEIDGVKFVKPE